MKLQGDIKFFYSDSEHTSIPGPGDTAVDGSALLRDKGFETSIIISLFTDARADRGDVLPDTVDNRGGYFGSELIGRQIGSKLWLLGRSKLDNTTLRLYEQYCKDALAWMLEDEIAEEITATAAAAANNRINFQMEVKRKENTNVSFKFFLNWEAQLAGGL